MYHVGDTMEAKVLKVNDGEGQVLLDIQDDLQQRRAIRDWKKHLNNHEVLKATVTQVLNGGLERSH